MPARVVVAHEWAQPAEKTAIARRRLCFLLALGLAIAPRLAVAEGLPGCGPITQLRPPTRDYGSLFHSPASRITRYPVGPMPLYAAAISGAVCRAALAAAEARYAIPAGLLQAIGIVASGRRN